MAEVIQRFLCLARILRTAEATGSKEHRAIACQDHIKLRQHGPQRCKRAVPHAHRETPQLGRVPRQTGAGARPSRQRAAEVSTTGRREECGYDRAHLPNDPASLSRPFARRRCCWSHTPGATTSNAYGQVRATPRPSPLSGFSPPPSPPPTVAVADSHCHLARLSPAGTIFLPANLRGVP
eukprot:6203750-Pleurochrysis_carterae.AAC.1